jgi:hypothetical protein
MTHWEHNGRDRTAGLPTLTDESLDDLMAAPLAVVIVAEAGSANAARYLAEVGARVARGGLPGVAVAVLDREAAAGGRFAREHPWLAELRLTPYTLVFALGRRVDGFAAIQADVLCARLAPSSPAAAACRSGRVGGGRPDADRWSTPLASGRQAA